jgi:hemerythrin-like metal-binding protein
MALLTWEDQFTVGIESMDRQHKLLFETLNELHRSWMKGEAKDLTEPLVWNLLAYVRQHFLAEEAMLANSNFPGLVQQRLLHRNLMQKVEQYAARFHKGENAIDLPFLQFLRDWLTNHVQNVDRSYRLWMMKYRIQQQRGIWEESTLEGELG